MLPNNHRLEVCITVDVEFDIAGALVPSGTRLPLGEVCLVREYEGRSQGMGFVLDTLKAGGLPATLFTEVFNTHYFGDGPITRVLERCHAEGHDVQLHLHPVWRYFMAPAWRNRLLGCRPNDSLAAREPEELDEILSDGIGIFRRLTGRDPIALRTGSLRADLGLYRALERHGITLTSNIGLGVFRPPEPQLRFFGGIHRVGAVTEVPVLSYQDFRLGSRPHIKLLTTVGSSWSEIRHLLLEARRRKAGPVVILVHAADFSAQILRNDTPGYRPRRIVQRRFRMLCEFLSDHPELFEVTTFAQRAAAWCSRPRPHEVALRVPVHSVVRRLAENNLFQN